MYLSGKTTASLGVGLGTAAMVLSIPSLTLGSLAYPKLQSLSQKEWSLHMAVDAMSSTNVAQLLGIQILDGVSLQVNARILLIGQSQAKDNGIWSVQLGHWTRPVDFPTGQPAKTPVVLVTSGELNGRSAWVGVTPKAIIDKDPNQWQKLHGNTERLPLRLENAGNGTGHVWVETSDPSQATHALRTFSSTSSPFLQIQDVSNPTQEIDFGLAVEENTSSLLSRNSQSVARANVWKVVDHVEVPSGFAGAPSIRWANQAGLSQSSGHLQFQTDGQVQALLTTSGAWVWNAYAGTPNFLHNDSSGNITSEAIYGPSDFAPNLPDSKLGVISAPGKVLDSATTATPLLVGNTIVRRDATGSSNVNDCVIWSKIIASDDNTTLPIDCPAGGIDVNLPGGLGLGVTLGNATFVPSPTVYGSVLQACKTSVINVYNLTQVVPTYQTVFNAPLIGSLTFAANTLRFGSVFSMSMIGTIVSAPASETLLFQFLSDSDAMPFQWNTGAGATNLSLEVSVEGTISSVGSLRAVATLQVSGELPVMAAQTVSVSWSPIVSHTLDLQAAWSAAGGSLDIVSSSCTLMNAV